VAPVVLVQDLTKGPYQSGVTPCAGTITWNTIDGAAGSSINILLNDKAGSLTPDLGSQFLGRSFSITWLEIQNVTGAGIETVDLMIRVGKRSDTLLGGVPSDAASLFSIQENDNGLAVPVEMFEFASGAEGGPNIYRTFLGDNTNTLGSRRQYEPEPNITIGPGGSIIITNINQPLIGQILRVSVRGFYQEQPS